MWIRPLHEDEQAELLEQQKRLEGYGTCQGVRMPAGDLRRLIDLERRAAATASAKFLAQLIGAASPYAWASRCEVSSATAWQKLALHLSKALSSVGVSIDISAFRLALNELEAIERLRGVIEQHRGEAEVPASVRKILWPECDQAVMVGWRSQVQPQSATVVAAVSWDQVTAALDAAESSCYDAVIRGDSPTEEKQT